jgi:hypothetical protein
VAVVKQLRVDSLQPGGALLDQRAAQAHQRAQLEDLLGRDPRLRHAPLLEQLAQMLRVGAVGLGPALGAAQDLGLRRLGQVHLGPDGLQLLHHEAPTRRRLERGLEPLAVELAHEVAKALAVGRPDAAPPKLARRAIKRIPGDLLSMLVQSHYDRHKGTSSASVDSRHQRASSRLS